MRELKEELTFTSETWVKHDEKRSVSQIFAHFSSAPFYASARLLLNHMKSVPGYCEI